MSLELPEGRLDLGGRLSSEIYIVNEVRDWIDSLGPASHAGVVQAIDLLAGCPLVDTIHSSSVANLKEPTTRR